MNTNYIQALILTSEQKKLFGSVFAKIHYNGYSYRGYLCNAEGKELKNTFTTEVIKVPKIFPLLPIEVLRAEKRLFTGCEKTGEYKDVNSVFDVLYMNLETAQNRVLNKSY